MLGGALAAASCWTSFGSPARAQDPLPSADGAREADAILKGYETLLGVIRSGGGAQVEKVLVTQLATPRQPPRSQVEAKGLLAYVRSKTGCRGAYALAGEAIAGQPPGEPPMIGVVLATLARDACAPAGAPAAALAAVATQLGDQGMFQTAVMAIPTLRLLRESGHIEDALVLAARIVTLIDAADGVTPLVRSKLLNEQGLALSAAGDPEAAARAYQDALALDIPVVTRLQLASNLTMTIAQGGDCEAAIPILERLVKNLVNRPLDTDSRDVVPAQYNLAVNLWRCRKGPYAEAVARWALKTVETSSGRDDPYRGMVLILLSTVVEKRGDLEEAARRLDQAEWVAQRDSAFSSRMLDEIAIGRGMIALRRGDAVRASRLFGSSAMRRWQANERDARTGADFSNWGASLAVARRFDAALDSWRFNLAVLSGVPPGGATSRADRRDDVNQYLEFAWSQYAGVQPPSGWWEQDPAFRNDR